MTDTLDATLAQFYEAFEGNPDVEAYHERHGVESLGILTVYDDERAGLIAEYLRPRIEDRIVVEVGGGIGLLGCHLATVARRVYCIEADPAWMSNFVHVLYRAKPKNLTYIFGAADECPPIAADVALFCSHSGLESLHLAAARFAPTVIDVYRELLPAKDRSVNQWLREHTVRSRAAGQA